jgi:hypothetical protein
MYFPISYTSPGKDVFSNKFQLPPGRIYFPISYPYPREGCIFQYVPPTPGKDVFSNKSPLPPGRM